MVVPPLADVREKLTPVTVCVVVTLTASVLVVAVTKVGAGGALGAVFIFCPSLNTPMPLLKIK